MLIIITMILIGCGMVFLQANYSSLARLKTNLGFGPEWDCVSQPKGDPICIKKKP